MTNTRNAVDDIYKRAWEIKPTLEKHEYTSHGGPSDKVDSYRVAVEFAHLQDRLSKIEACLSLFFPEEYPNV